MIVIARIFALLLLLVAGVPAAMAQTPSPQAAAEIEALVKTLENDAERAKLVAQLKQLIAAEREVAKDAEPDIVDDVLLKVVSDRVAEAGRTLTLFFGQFRDLTRVSDWATAQMSTSEGQSFWSWVLVDVLIVIGAGIAANRLVDWGLGRLRARFAGAEAPTSWRRFWPLVALFLLDLLPIVAFAGASALALMLVAPSERIGLLLFALINAGWIAGAVGALGRMVLAPLAPALRVPPIRDETAAYLFVWLRRLAGLAIYGGFFFEAALALGLPKGGHAAAVRLLGLLFAGLVIVLALQNRIAVAVAIRGSAKKRHDRARAIRIVVDRLADIWHLLVVLYVFGLFVVWALDIEGGFFFVLRGTALTAAIVGVAVGLRMLAERGITRLFSVGAEMKARFPLLEERANRYVPALKAIVGAAIWIVAVVCFLETWRIDILGWVSSGAGRILLGKLATVAIIGGVAVAGLEAFSIGAQRYIEKLERKNEAVRVARARTLMPLVNLAVRIVVAVFAGLAVLSELGINIGPLLAGAGAIGLAVGLGAQNLVKDLIAGFSILFENTVSIGDTVDANGKVGVVESLSLKTVRLRDGAGNVHTIPLSGLVHITNMTRDFSYAQLEMPFAHGQSVGKIHEALMAVDAAYRTDPARAADLKGPIEVAGLERFTDAGFVVKAKIKTAPGRQWDTQRGYNALIPEIFAARGVALLGQGVSRV